MTEALSRGRRLAIISLTFIVSLTIFLYSSFPYSVLKEWVAAEVNRATGLGLRIGRMSANFPLGIELERVEFGGQKGELVKLSSVSVNASLFLLLSGRIGINADVIGADATGRLSLSGRMPLTRLLSQQMIPSRLVLKSSNFPIGPIVNYLVQSEAQSPATNPMLRDLLSKIRIQGNLDADVDVDVDASDPQQSKGHADLNLVSSNIVFDPELSIAAQEFSKAKLKVGIDGGKLTIDKASGFSSQEFHFDIDGRVELKESFDRSLVNLRIAVKLEDSLKENFGLILTAVSQGRASDGAMALQISGPLSAPSVVSM